MHDPTEVDRGDARPTRSSGLSFVGLLMGAVLVAVLLGQLTEPDRASTPPAAAARTAAVSQLPETTEPDRAIGADSLKLCPVRLGGLTLGSRLLVQGWALERWDCIALKGPWSVVIRATDGHLGLHGAVVTFPVDSQGSGTAVATPQGGRWDSTRQMLIWPLAGHHAQIVGDLGQAELTDLATHVTVAGGKPHLPTLDGFTSAATTTYRPPVVHELRYSTGDLAQAGRLGSGVVYTGVMSGAMFETLAFEARGKSAGFVRGKPAVYSRVEGTFDSHGQGNSGTLAWESAPGEVTYIGFSGGATDADAIESLRALANRGRMLTAAQWETKDRIPASSQRG